MKKLLKHKYTPYFMLAFLAVVWGSSFLLIKKGLVQFNPIEVASLRVFFAAVFLMPIAMKRIGRLPKIEYIKVTYLGLVGNFIPALLFAIAQTQITSSLSGILNALSPLFTLLIARLFFKHRIVLAQTIGLIIGFVGSIGLSFINKDGNLGAMNFYVLFVVGATMCYALNGNFIKHKFDKYTALTLTSVSFFFIGLIALAIIIYIGLPGKIFGHIGEYSDSLISIVALAFLGTSVALLIYNKLIMMTSPIFASSVTYLVPIVAVFFGLLDNEHLTWWHIGGMVMIIIGVYITNKASK
ncbi:MAG: DMT family transporter [Bacteroidetes bacterium]|nr:DMT family transporter [Bacteroidota bacterium]